MDCSKAINSSDLKRAKDTKKEIKKFHLNVPIKFVKEDSRLGNKEIKKISK